MTPVASPSSWEGIGSANSTFTRWACSVCITGMELRDRVTVFTAIRAQSSACRGERTMTSRRPSSSLAWGSSSTPPVSIPQLATITVRTLNRRG